MRIFALCLALGQDASRVAELISALEDDSIEVRDAAESDLVRLGEAARAPLERARREASIVEVSARIDDILTRIELDRRRRGFAGGAAVGGLSAGLRVREDKLKSKLRLTLEVMNVEPASRDLALVDTWNSRLPGVSSTSSAAQAGFVVLQISGERPQRIQLRCAGAGDPMRITVRLQPGESRTFERVLDLKELAAGHYAVHAEYYATKLLGSAEDVRSNTCHFRVAP